MIQASEELKHRQALGWESYYLYVQHQINRTEWYEQRYVMGVDFGYELMEHVGRLAGVEVYTKTNAKVMSTKFKQGDTIKVTKRSWGTSGHLIGGIYKLKSNDGTTSNNGDSDIYWRVEGSGDWWVLERDMELLDNSNTVMSNLVSKFRLATKSEPEKSFIKAGVMNMDESLTTEGDQLFKAFLLQKFGSDFKKEVVDPILAEDEKNK